jgi:hypothetical protein
MPKRRPLPISKSKDRTSYFILLTALSDRRKLGYPFPTFLGKETKMFRLTSGSRRAKGRKPNYTPLLELLEQRQVPASIGFKFQRVQRE